jgi:hypothetical protein
MISTPNTSTPKVRDLNRLLNWLDDIEGRIVAYGKETNTDLYLDYATHHKLDEQARLFYILFEDVMRRLMKMNRSELPPQEYLEQLPIAEVVTTAALSCELTFQMIAREADLENSFGLFAVEDYIPKIVHWVASITGDADHGALNTALNTPISKFIQPKNND